MKSISITVLASCLTVAASSPTLAAEPPSEDVLPRYDDPVPTPADPPDPPDRVPNDGRGLLAAGGIVTIGGAASLVSGIVLIATGDGNTRSDFWPLLVVGGVGATAGSLLLGWGVPHHRDYRKWEAQQHDTIPRQGLGLIGAGTALVVGGMAGTVISGSIWKAQNETLRIYLDPNRPTRLAGAKVGVGLGITSIALGTTLLAAGIVRLKRFSAWRRAHSVLMPTLMPTRSALYVGLVGRF